MRNVREKFWRRFWMDPLGVLYAMKKSGVDHKILRHLAKTALKVDDLKFRKSVRDVVTEMYQENAAAADWLIRKSLSPTFREGEIVNFTENGISRKGKIKKMGKIGATIEPVGFPMLQYQIPGSRILKCLG